MYSETAAISSGLKPKATSSRIALSAISFDSETTRGDRLSSNDAFSIISITLLKKALDNTKNPY
jgi:hypothetical protein